ncbi:MAG: VCBS repeat-containing protein, partial [Acidobacteria bacterium]|nr:VCBS repeat-containing protein [Acidobacteriota bacterium]
MVVTRGSSRCVVALAASWLLACSPPGDQPPFVDISAEVGLAFEHDNGMTGERYFSEVVGPGAALFDYDNDGDLDAFIVQGGSLDPAADPATLPADMLWRNDSTPGQDPPLRFVDVSAASGLDSSGYGMGVATGDVNGDGRIDLYV